MYLYISPGLHVRIHTLVHTLYFDYPILVSLYIDQPAYAAVGDYNKTEGLNLTILLTIDAFPDPHTFNWYKDGLKLETTTERVMFGIDYIKFLPASLEDSGNYTVDATNDIGTGKTSFRVEILCTLTVSVKNVQWSFMYCVQF